TARSFPSSAAKPAFGTKDDHGSFLSSIVRLRRAAFGPGQDGNAMQTSPMPQGDLGPLDLSRIAQDLQIRKVQVETVVQLLDEGNTVPFITRYRKERTGGLDEEVLRAIQDRIALLRQLAERKQTVLKSIENQGKLTDELRAAILAAETPRRLE